jgi:hypothetical protein
MVEPTWDSIEQPILEAAVAAEGRGHNIAEAIEDIGLSEPDRIRGIRGLVEDGYLLGDDVTSWGDIGSIYDVVGVTAKARRATRQWPAQRAYDDFVDILEQRIAATSDESKKSRLRAVLGTIREVGQDVATDVFAKVIEHQAGMG